MIKFNIGGINLQTQCEGPHKRLAIWFQGCMLNCKGCCNPDYQALEARNIIELDKLIEIIKSSKENYEIEGVTYLGGEPTLQANLQALSKEIKKLDLGIICFTGRNYEDVIDRVEHCDLVIDGKFDESKLDTQRKLIGSSNQRLIYLTDRYKKDEQWFYENKTKTVEVNVSDSIVINGEVVIN